MGHVKYMGTQIDAEIEEAVWFDRMETASNNRRVKLMLLKILITIASASRVSLFSFVFARN